MTYISLIIILILFILFINNTSEPFTESDPYIPILNDVNGFWYFANTVDGPYNLPLNYYAVLNIKYIKPNQISMTGNMQNKLININNITDNTIDTDDFLFTYRYPFLHLTDKTLDKTVVLHKITGTDINSPKFNKRLLGFNGTWYSKQKFIRAQPGPSVTFKILNNKIMETGLNNYTLFTAMNNTNLALDTPDPAHQLNYNLTDNNTITISTNDAWVDVLKKNN